ncbi:MAG: alpha/beta hydrolase [Rhizomicrobium sp.]
MLRIVLRVLLALFVLVLVAALAFLGYRAFRQHANAAAAVIAAPDGVDEKAFVPLGGIEQWVTIRGQDRANPVILILHGGPGGAMSQLAPVFRAWEKDFTVVQWDQRGSGRTYGRNGANEQPMTVDRMVRDGIELTQYLLIHLHKRKLVLLGHSWGSELGVLMVKADPGLFSAYVGTGQVVAKEAKEEVLYTRLMAKLAAARDADGIAKLKSVGPPPYKSEADLGVEREIQKRFETDAEKNLQAAMTPIVLYSPDVSLRDIYDFFQGQTFAGEALYRELLGYDARKLGPRFDVPMFVFNGDRDLTTPHDLAKAWFDGIEAPHKEFVLLEGGGHSALMTMPDRFLRELNARVRPLAAGL